MSDIVEANHYCAVGDGGDLEPRAASRLRFERMAELLGKLYDRGTTADLPWDLVRILADAGVEVRGQDYGTVYANVACPSQHTVWYTFGGYPAASAGAWRRIEWPWEKS
jgi:hypothetical protein